MKQTLSVKNWDEFQHYKDRNPPWIKLHNTLLEDYEFECLQDASKGHLLCIWMLASRTNNKIPYDSAWVARKIGASDKVDLDLLLSSGFLVLNQPLPSVEHDASKALQDVEHIAIPEESRGETETETETEQPLSSPPKSDAVPYQAIQDSYHKHLPMLPRVKVLTDARKRHIKARWAKVQKDGKDMSYFDGFFDHVSGSEFLRTGSFCNLEWLMKEANFVKVIEGNYHNE